MLNSQEGHSLAFPCSSMRRSGVGAGVKHYPLNQGLRSSGRSTAARGHAKTIRTNSQWHDWRMGRTL